MMSKQLRLSASISIALTAMFALATAIDARTGYGAPHDRGAVPFFQVSVGR